MIYVGVVAQLLGHGHDPVEAAVRKQFGRKVKAAELNAAAVRAGYEYADANLSEGRPVHIEPMDKTAARSSSTATRPAALGAIFAGSPW